MATIPDVQIGQRARYGQQLIMGVIRFVRELAEQNVTITKFYATSSTPTRIAILENAQFKKIGQIGKRIAFELDTMQSDAPLAKQYREMLQVPK